MHRDLTMSQMLKESRCGTEHGYNLPSQRPPTPTTRNFEYTGLSDMLEAALGTSENTLLMEEANPRVAKLEELKKALPMIIRSAFQAAYQEFSDKPVQRGYGLGDMLEDAAHGSR
jgi:hypothetical protein